MTEPEFVPFTVDHGPLYDRLRSTIKHMVRNVKSYGASAVGADQLANDLNQVLDQVNGLYVAMLPELPDTERLFRMANVESEGSASVAIDLTYLSTDNLDVKPAAVAEVPQPSFQLPEDDDSATIIPPTKVPAGNKKRKRRSKKAKVSATPPTNVRRSLPNPHRHLQRRKVFPKRRREPPEVLTTKASS